MPDYYDGIAFHCQQAMEKSLTGYLVRFDVEFKPVDDLGYLVNLASARDHKMDAWYEGVDEISRYAMQVRYPDALIMLSNDQIAAAIVTANMMLTWSAKKSGNQSFLFLGTPACYLF